jgi:hypothetical protein
LCNKPDRSEIPAFAGWERIAGLSMLECRNVGFQKLFSSKITKEKENEHNHDKNNKQGGIKSGLKNVAYQFAGLDDDA